MTLALAPRNSLFGEFRLRGYRGGGGFSDVYEAVSPRGRRVAIKVLRTGPMALSENRRRLERELRILETLEIRRISRLVHAELDQDPPWIASEYVDGPTLREAVEQRGSFDLKTVVALVGCLARTLSELHAAGIAHRDLTPNNVLLDDLGPVIIDFGSAGYLAGEGRSSVLSVATPGYASPEVLAQRKAGSAADIYGIARLASFALSGGDTKQTEFSGLTTEQSATLLRCLAADPDQRPSATELLRHFSIDEIPAQLRSKYYAPVTLRKLPRRVRPITTAILVAIGVVAATLGTWSLTAQNKVVSFAEVTASFGGTESVTPMSINSGWLTSVPSQTTSLTSYRRPVDIGRGESGLALEAYEMRNSTGGVVRISSELLPLSVRDELKQIVPTSGSSVALAKIPNFTALFERETRLVRDALVPAQCRFISMTRGEIVKAGESAVIRLAATSEDCVDENGQTKRIAIVVSVSLDHNVLVHTTLFGGDAMPALDQIVKVTQGRAESPVRELVDDQLQLLEPEIDQASLRIGSSSRFFRRAFALPAGRALVISAPQEVTARLAFQALTNATKDGFTITAGAGSLEPLPAGRSFAINNPSSDNWVIIVELDERSGASSLDVRISLGDVTNTSVAVDDFSAGVIPEQTLTPEQFDYLLPRAEGLWKQPSFIKVGDLALPIPSEWIITLESNSRSAIALNANPTSSYLAFLEDDSPRLDIVSERVSELVDRRRVEEWLNQTPYESCKNISKYVIEDRGTRFEWQVYVGCVVNEAISNQAVSRMRPQLAPIIRFGLSVQLDTDGDNKSDFDFGSMRGEYVPQFAGESKFWREFVDSVTSQFDLVRAAQIAVCKDVFGNIVCSATP